MAAVASPPASSEFISGTAAIRLLGAGWYTLQSHALTGDVRTDVRMGRAVRYHRDDVERLAAARREAAAAAR
jgi:hypothetical protein